MSADAKNMDSRAAHDLGTDDDGSLDGAELLLGTELGSDDGALLLLGTDEGSLDGALLLLGTDDGELEGSDDGTLLLLGTEEGSLDGAELSGASPADSSSWGTPAEPEPSSLTLPSCVGSTSSASGTPCRASAASPMSKASPTASARPSPAVCKRAPWAVSGSSSDLSTSAVASLLVTAFAIATAALLAGSARPKRFFALFIAQRKVVSGSASRFVLSQSCWPWLQEVVSAITTASKLAWSSACC